MGRISGLEADMIRMFVKAKLDCEKQKKAYGHILSTVGYRLPLQEMDSKSNKDNSAIMRRIRLDWKENKKRRQARKYEIENATRCESIRRISGSFDYVDIDSGSMISPEEYKRRYSMYISSLKEAAQNLDELDLTVCKEEEISAKSKLLKNSLESVNQNALDVLVTAASSMNKAWVPCDHTPQKQQRKRSILSTNHIDSNDFSIADNTPIG